MKLLHLFSGGFDSQCLALQRHYEGNEVHGLYFDYGQKTNDLDAAACEKFTKKFGIPIHSVSLRDISSLFKCDYMDDSKETFSAAVPHRSLLFYTLAAQFAITRGGYAFIESALWERMDVMKNGFPGLSTIDRAEFETIKSHYGYDELEPHTDSRYDFMVALDNALKISEPDSPVRVSVPYIYKDKLWLWNQYDKMGLLDWAINETLTCYNLDQVKNDWGPGCGGCGSCSSREIGYWLFRKAKELNVNIENLYP